LNEPKRHFNFKHVHQRFE